MDKELEGLKKRIERLESKVFGMTEYKAQEALDGYLEIARRNPQIDPSPYVLEAERMLGV